MKLLLALLFTLLISVNVNAQDSVKLTSQNTMSLNDSVNGQSMTELMQKLTELNKIETDEPIYLVINSPGGSVYDGFDFIRFAATSKRKIKTVTIFAASMAFQIVQSLDERLVTSYSTLMSHKASGGFKGEFPGQLDSRYAHVLSHIREQDQQVVKRTKGKQTLESYAALIQNEYWGNSARSIEDGFADREVQVSCDASLQGSENKVMDFGFFALNVEFANCPLITNPISVSAARNEFYIRENNINMEDTVKKAYKIRQFSY